MGTPRAPAEWTQQVPGLLGLDYVSQLVQQEAPAQVLHLDVVQDVGLPELVVVVQPVQSGDLEPVTPPVLE